MKASCGIACRVGDDPTVTFVMARKWKGGILYVLIFGSDLCLKCSVCHDWLA